LYTRRPYFILYIIIILSIGILISHVLLLSTEVCCWAQAQSQEQSNGTTDITPVTPITPGQQPQSPSPAIGPGRQAILPQVPDKNSSEIQNREPAITPEKTDLQIPSAQQKIPLKPGETASGQAIGIPGQKVESSLQDQQKKQNESGKTGDVQTPQTLTAPGLQPPQGQVPPASLRRPFGMQQPQFQPNLQMVPGPAPRRGQFTLNFDDADVYMIIQTVFGEVLKVNYIVDPRVKGRVTFRAVAPVPAENVLPLMEVILRLNGIGVVEESGLYRIVPLSDISKEPSPVSYGRDPAKIPTTGKALLQVVPITYVQSSEVLKLIAPFASTNAVLIDVPKGNQIIIVDTDANVKRLLKLVELFDNETLKKRKPQVFVYQVQNSKAKDIANLLQQIYLGGKATTTERPSTPSRISPSTLGSSQSTPSTLPASSLPQVSTISTSGEILVSDFTRIIPDEITNTVIIMSTPEDYTAIRKTIEEIDVVPRQVVIEGMIASVALTDNLSFGISALFKGNISNFGGSADIGTRFALNPQSLAVDPNNLSLGGFTFVGVDTAGTVRALITALATDSKAKVLAAPHILVSDNRDAKIQVGQQVPLITTETYGSTTIAPQRTFQYRDIGIILKVKPRINAGGLVSLEIYQEISTFETITLSGDQQILLDKTDVTTELVVQDGQTIVIGGLIREDTTKSRSGIPFLSRIPLIGWLFGNTEDDIKRQELIILLTPHVIKNQKEAKDMSTEFVDKMTESSEGRIKKEELIKEKRQKQNGINHPEAPGGKVK